MNEEMNNKKSNVLLIVLIMLLVLCLIGLTGYKVFIYDKKDNNKNSGNKVEEKTDNKQEESNSEKVALPDKLKEKIDELLYVNIIKYNISYEELYKTKIAFDTLEKLIGDDGPGLSSKILKGNIVKSKAKELYNYDLTYNADTDIPLDKLFFNGNSSIYASYNKSKDEYTVGRQGVLGGGAHSTTVINTTKDDSIYKVDIVDGVYYYYGDGNDCTFIDKTGEAKNMKCFSTSENVVDEEVLIDMMNDFSLQHKDELPQYEISFKINGNNYEFADIKKIGEVSENKASGVTTLDINDAEVKKYYNYVSSDGMLKGHLELSNPDFNYLLNLKAYFAITKIKNLMEIKNCLDYADYIDEATNGKGICVSSANKESSCDSKINRNKDTKVNIIPGQILRKAVETIYGKDNYKDGTFSVEPGSTNIFNYFEKKDEYINLRTACGSNYVGEYSSTIIKAEQKENQMYIYEKFDKSENAINFDLTIKHTFEKNTYDDNYHYVKSEKA